MPELLEVEWFYYDMGLKCGGDFNSIVTYCNLYSLSNEETLEAVDIILKIHSRLQNAGS